MKEAAARMVSEEGERGRDVRIVVGDYSEGQVTAVHFDVGSSKDLFPIHLRTRRSCRGSCEGGRSSDRRRRSRGGGDDSSFRDFV